jgi:hypothetical protein
MNTFCSVSMSELEREYRERCDQHDETLSSRPQPLAIPLFLLAAPAKVESEPHVAAVFLESAFLRSS